MWVDDTEYDPLKFCTLCDKEYGTSKAIFKTPCDHLFHNNCLKDYCEDKEKEEKIKKVKNKEYKMEAPGCPVCGKDIGYSCIDVWAFKEKLLGNPDGNPLFEGNKHILDIYDAQVQDQEGGKKRRTKRNRTKRNRTKRNRTKRLRTKRHFRVKK
jgi:hypothetical protein